MKNVVYFVALMLLPFWANSAEYFEEGKVADILIRTGSEDYAILYVDGFKEAGGCKTFREHVIISIPNDEKAIARYSMLLNLHMLDKNVHVKLDNTKTNSDGYCILQDVRLNKNF